MIENEKYQRNKIPFSSSVKRNFFEKHLTASYEASQGKKKLKKIKKFSEKFLKSVNLGYPISSYSFIGHKHSQFYKNKINEIKKPRNDVFFFF